MRRARRGKYGNYGRSGGQHKKSAPAFARARSIAALEGSLLRCFCGFIRNRRVGALWEGPKTTHREESGKQKTRSCRTQELARSSAQENERQKKDHEPGQSENRARSRTRPTGEGGERIADTTRRYLISDSRFGNLAPE